MRRHHLILAAAILAIAALTSGCGGGGGGSSSGGSLSADIGLVSADYLVLDLATGAVETRQAIGDLSAYRSGQMVFRSVDAASCTIGSAPGDFGHQSDETETASSVGKYYIAICEVTQAQWQAIGGATPWTDPDQAAIGGTAAGGKPAFALSFDAVQDGLAAWNGTHAVRLALPTPVQWEHACRGGSGDEYSWGPEHDEATAELYAAVSETAAGVSGPRVVASLGANALGIYDAHGNVWEWAAVTATTGQLRGGSWSDSLSMARCANKVELDEFTEHALVGARLVLVP
ncbi:MAG TPA: formylglycine-generating enzyme family protein [Planctomycetota bacterium]|nr:formylglycine-generating enzyme family protein [Planctomycetota bacterium]